MLPEVEEYLAAVSEASQKLHAWHVTSRKDAPKRPHGGWAGFDDPAYRKFTREYQVWQDGFNKRYAEVNEEHEDIVRAARVKLRETTSDPVVRWIVSTLAGSYGDYVDTVLPILPATREELESHANEHDWCEEFDALMERATQAGVIPPRDDMAGYARELIDWVADTFDVGPRRHAREIRGMVNRIVDKVLADAVQGAVEQKSKVSA